MLDSALLEKDFIGRKRETEILFELYSEVKRGIATSIFLSGQPGVGKTELLRQIYRLLFQNQYEVVPFFYSINPAIVSLPDFSTDYLTKFICQWIAFRKKDISLIHASGLSIEDIIQLAKDSDAHWAVEIIEGLLRAKNSGDLTKLFLTAVSAPYQSYLRTGIPAVVIIDEFHRIREVYGDSSETSKTLWTYFEELIMIRQTPHILSGSQSVLQEMFFQKTSLGKSLELFKLSGLNKSDSLKLFSSLTDNYNITVDKEILPSFVEMFNGNPFYIRNFVQAARREGKNLSGNDLQRAYFNEIANGKFYAYWTSQLKTYLPRLELRKNSLKVLYHFCNNGSSADVSDIASILSIDAKDIEEIINIFQSVGLMEADFIEYRLTEDRVLSDVIKVLYNKEIQKKPLSLIEEEITMDAYLPSKAAETPVFEVTVPFMQGAELIAVNALEQIGGKQHIRGEVIGQLQVTLIDLFTNIIPVGESVNRGFHLKLEPREDTFTIEVKTPYKELPSSIMEEQLIKRYIDDIRLEETRSGTKIILIKRL